MKRSVERQRRKAAEELKKEQERRAEERRRIIRERSGNPKNIDGCNEATLQAIVKEYHKRLEQLESEKFDLEYATQCKELEIKQLMEKVNKAGKLLEKIRLFTARVAHFDYRGQLKTVQKTDYVLDEKEKKKEEAKPEWIKT
ncbi:troponin I-like isoform X3 [Dinothrombium tinctorium]|uniref:Troponin I-like isoform X3 n=1 Tax=Dinothrombium tinctorium TaxID=1965070 RepID=A0A3S3PWB2_9ACAR|nr:troponin I-like isoform X3 [Dinothrombium tinctorium]